MPSCQLVWAHAKELHPSDIRNMSTAFLYDKTTLLRHYGKLAEGPQLRNAVVGTFRYLPANLVGIQQMSWLLGGEGGECFQIGFGV